MSQPSHVSTLILSIPFTPYSTLTHVGLAVLIHPAAQTRSRGTTTELFLSESPRNRAYWLQLSLLSAGITSKCAINRIFLSSSTITPYINIIFLAIMKHQKQASYKEKDFFSQNASSTAWWYTFWTGSPQHIMPCSVATAGMCEGRRAHPLEQEARETGRVQRAIVKASLKNCPESQEKYPIPSKLLPPVDPRASH